MPEHGGLVPALNPRTLDRRVDFSGMNNISLYSTLAAKRALDCAGAELSRSQSEKIGITAAISRGSSESRHMDAVFSNPDRRGDVGCFSNVTANSTAGWVSKALDIKGPNITLTPGPNGGLQAVGYSLDVLRERRAEKVIAFAADELYAQQMAGYDKSATCIPAERRRISGCASATRSKPFTARARARSFSRLAMPPKGAARKFTVLFCRSPPMKSPESSRTPTSAERGWKLRWRGRFPAPESGRGKSTS